MLPAHNIEYQDSGGRPSLVNAAHIPSLTHSEAAELATVELACFLTLLESLAPAEWEQPTACPLWNVRQVVAHVTGAAALATTGPEVARAWQRASGDRAEMRRPRPVSCTPVREIGCFTRRRRGLAFPYARCAGCEIILAGGKCMARPEQEGEKRMYYRVAIQRDSAALWTWKSTVLSELAAVLQWLRLYRTLPQDRLRVFSCSSREEMNEQLVRVNQGGVSTSVTAAQFLHERMISSPGVVWRAPADETPRNERVTSIAVVTELPPDESDREVRPLAERGTSFLEQRRGELERGVGGDHDCPYRFTLPSSMPQVLAWVKLLVRVQDSM